MQALHGTLVAGGFGPFSHCCNFLEHLKSQTYRDTFAAPNLEKTLSSPKPRQKPLKLQI